MVGVVDSVPDTTENSDAGGAQIGADNSESSQ
jgi:hypothetical protein